MKKFFVAVVLALSLSSFLYAQQQEETVTIKKSELTTQQLERLNQEQIQQKVEQYGKWVGVGHEVGVAVDESLKAITDTTVKLADTKAGKFTMAMVAIKIIGPMAVHTILGTLVWLIGSILFAWSYWKTCMPRRILSGVGKSKEGEVTKSYTIVNSENDSYVEDRRLTHGFFYIALCVLSALMVFTW